MKESILTMRLGSIADAALLKAPLTADSQQLAASSCQSRYWICCVTLLQGDRRRTYFRGEEIGRDDACLALILLLEKHDVVRKEIKGGHVGDLDFLKKSCL